MNKEELRKKIGTKIRIIRYQQANEHGRSMSQGEFCVLLNKTEPTDLNIDPGSLGMYERGDQNCPSDKYEKILSLDKDK